MGVGAASILLADHQGKVKRGWDWWTMTVLILKPLTLRNSPE